MPTLIKPRRLAAGDRIATVSPSWGGPGAVPHRYEAGKRQLEAEFGVTVVEMQHTLAPADWVSANPRARADDIMAAFADPDIAGIFCTIGGDDSIRLLPYLDLSVIRANPKIFLGYSDTTSLHLACYTAGLTSFYGPAIMSGFGENGGMHRYTADAVRAALFSTAPIGRILENAEGWTVERTEWGNPVAQAVPRKLHAADAPRTLQGSGKVTGHLLGGCAEVLEMAKGSPWWPSAAAWDGALLFLETSEETPKPDSVRRWIRNYAASGIIARLSGMLISRADPGSEPGYQQDLEHAIQAELADWGYTDLPVLAGHDFGHTMPMLTLPYGVRAEIDCDTATLSILDAGVC